MLQPGPVLIKAKQCDWEAYLAAGSVFTPEIEEKLGARFQTHCRGTTDWKSLLRYNHQIVSFLLAEVRNFFFELIYPMSDK